MLFVHTWRLRDAEENGRERPFNWHEAGELCRKYFLPRMTEAERAGSEGQRWKKCHNCVIMSRSVRSLLAQVAETLEGFLLLYELFSCSHVSRPFSPFSDHLRAFRALHNILASHSLESAFALPFAYFGFCCFPFNCSMAHNFLQFT